MPKDCIYISAKIRLKTTAEGGRHNGIITGYRPNHVFEYSKNGKIHAFIGEIQFEEGKTIQLGVEESVRICFMKIDQVKEYLTVGRHWFLHEGKRLIGEGTIISIE
ncbi:MAG: hypothetical protein ACK476_03415 [Fluviicola sp.]|jgi:hypothetical protein